MWMRTPAFTAADTKPGGVSRRCSTMRTSTPFWTPYVGPVGASGRGDGTVTSTNDPSHGRSFKRKKTKDKVKTMRWLTLGVMAFLLATAAGCTSTAPYRKVYDDRENPRKDKSPECSSVEQTPGFQIAYVELTDQGLLHDRRQMTKALELLGNEGEQILNIVVFIHGWKHSAACDDNNVINFRDKIIPNITDTQKGSRTVGIYVGWRGAVFEGPSALQNITFYDRKSTADHVARGSVRELIAHLRSIRNESNRDNQSRLPGRKVRLTLIGHSFGGLILYNAIAESIFDSIVTAHHGDLTSLREAAPTADLVLLLNPAFEASRFEPLFQAAKDGLSKDEKDEGKLRFYPKQQRPILVSITSEADLATKIAFPLGRWVNTLLQHEGLTSEDKPTEDPVKDYANRIEKLANTHTIGHLERYRTHRLESGSSQQSAPSDQLTIDCKVVQNPLIADSNRFPLWNLYATEHVMDGHDDIFRPNLWHFVRQISDPKTNLVDICDKPQTSAS